MLVLTRREGQGVILNDSVVVVVLESNNGRVRLGLEAPDDVRIRRSEARDPSPARHNDNRRSEEPFSQADQGAAIDHSV